MKSRKEIILELTPLLDVILIMMFYILMQNSLASQKEQKSAQEQIVQIQESAKTELSQVQESASAEVESIKAEYNVKESIISDELAVAEAKAEGQQTFESYALIAEIVIVNGKEGNRNLHVICGEEDDIISYNWDNINYAENALKNSIDKLVKQASKDKPVFIVFKYRDSEIFMRDYELVQDVLSKRASKGNVYIKYYGGES